MAGFVTRFQNKRNRLGIDIYFVPCMSVHPTLNPGNVALAGKRAYQNHSPEKNDVMVFRLTGGRSLVVKHIGLWSARSIRMGERKMKIVDVARGTGLNRNAVALLYKETAQMIDLEAIEKLCRLFECEVGDLLELQEDH
jgi:putative transcriptional regulator